MKLINERLLRQFREVFVCEYCGKKTQGADAAHVFSRGAGRVDIAENLVSLCRVCHTSSHGHPDNHPRFDELIAIAAKREHTSPEAIEQMVYAIRAWTGTKQMVVEE